MENWVRDMVSAWGEEAWMFFFLSLGPRADQAAAFPPPAWSLTAPTDMGSRHPRPDPVPPDELIGKAAWKAQPGGGVGRAPKKGPEQEGAGQLELES